MCVSVGWLKRRRVGRERVEEGGRLRREVCGWCRGHSRADKFRVAGSEGCCELGNEGEGRSGKEIRESD